ncbi:Verru_Chthon cassette protein D [Roseimicrobium gellanilyticum]|nr:Verru_Chthon cassette protein D [Roseimicrobium gellanilyticum]
MSPGQSRGKGLPHMRTSAARGFTLIEIMVVMTIMLLLMGVSIGVTNSWKAQKLSTEARQLSSQLAEVALLAQKDNYPVEVRFYLLPNEFGDGSSTAMRAIQIARLTGYDTTTRRPQYKFLTEVRFFEDDIILMDTKDYTSLCSVEPTPAGEKDPEIRGQQRSYRSFLFLPNGSTSLPRTPDTVFTLVKESEMTSAKEPPPNYRSVVLQPVTGKATVY